MENEQKQLSDHDLLIVISTKLERVILDVKDLSDNLVGKVEKLECDKADKQEMTTLHNTTLTRLDKVDEKISSLERYRYILVGSIGVMLFVIDYIIKKYF